VRNNYTKDVYNGDIGFIQEIDIDNEVIAIQYDDRVVSYAFYELDDVVLAYAVTVHKSQGSEYKAVVMPLTTQHYIMLQRNLLYTAVTRAKELMILIGTKKALNIAVRNNKTAQRYTYLAERLRTLEGVSSQLNLPDTLKDSLQEWY
jgi:exodeoxyribonuclease V alpha subunit